MRIIPRAEWGARHDNGFGPRTLPATQAWLHHSVTIAPDLVPPFDDDYAAIRALEQIGEARFGRGMSYTRLITPAGLIFEGHSIDRVGSHTANRNTVAVGYCLVGNYSASHPTAEQMLALAWCLQHDHTNGWLDAPRLDGGHRDLKATACPGDHAYAAITAINQRAAGAPIEEEEPMPTVNEILDGIEQRRYDTDGDGQPDRSLVNIATQGMWDAGAARASCQRIEAGLAAVAAAVAEGDLDPDAVLARVDAAVREATEQAITATVLPALRATLVEVLGEDNTEQADAIVTRLSERLRPVA